MIPYGRQNISDEDIEKVVQVLRSDFITQGELVPEFESKTSGLCDAKEGVAVNSATSALHIACLALDVGPGDIVWTVPNTFVASANCALYCGADVDFVDIDPLTANMSVPELAKKLEAASNAGKLPKVLIPVHFGGEPPEMADIFRLSERFGFRTIEDASHSIGGMYGNSIIGSCKYSDITIFSFHPVKIVTTAEGGMALTNNSDLASHMRLLRSHGITRDSDLMVGEPEGPWYYEQVDLGVNYRMTEIQAALGLSQLDRLQVFSDRRQYLAARYDELLASLPVRPLYRSPTNRSGLHLYVIRLNLGEIEKTRRQVFEDMRSAGIGVNVHYIPVHTQPYFRDLGFKRGDFPKAEKYYEEAITLPLFPDLTDEQQDLVAETLGSIVT